MWALKLATVPYKGEGGGHKDTPYGNWVLVSMRLVLSEPGNKGR